MLTKIFRVCLVLFILFYLYLVFSPARFHASDVAEAHVAAQARFHELQQHDTPAENGYLEPAFLELWGTKDVQLSDGPMRKKLRNWNEFSPFATGEPQDCRKLKAENPLGSVSQVKYSDARADFEKLLPDLERALGKPYFFKAYPRMSFANLVPNFIALRACAQAFGAYAINLAAEGRDAEIPAVLLASFTNGRDLAKDGSTLIQSMIGAAIQAIAFDAARASLRPDSNLTAAQWKDLARKLQAQAIPANQTVMDIQNELTMVFETFKNWSDIQSELDQGDRVSLQAVRYTGLLQRELRIYDNQMGDLLAAVKADKPLPRMPDFAFASYVRGKSGPVAAILVPNMERAAAHTRLLRARVLGLAAFCALEAYRLEKGQLPKQLGDLSQIGYQPETDELRWNAETKKLTAVVSSETLETTQMLQPPSAHDWIHNFAWISYSPEGVNFQL